MTSVPAVPRSGSRGPLRPPVCLSPTLVIHLDGSVELYLPPRSRNYLWLLLALGLTPFHPDVLPSGEKGTWLIAPRHRRVIMRAVAGEFGPFNLSFSGDAMDSLPWEELFLLDSNPLPGEQLFEDAAAS